jgi:S-adenosylmethionine hydrolase
VRLSLPKPEKTSRGWRAHVTIIDHFGNLTTDLPAAALTDKKHVIFLLDKHAVHGLVTSYGHKKTGELVALVNSENYLEIAIVNGSAAQVLGAKAGDIVEVIFES